jgi:small subunit ribosomal protein S4
MGRKLGSKCKLCRRQGEKLNLKGEKCVSGKCPVVTRNFPPGQHGPTARPRHTGYGLQLREKQKAKNTYGLLETQFRNYFEKAANIPGNTADHLVGMLEMRLDNVVYRLGLAKSRALARQNVSHGSVRVNGKKVTIPSYALKPGDVIGFSERFAKSKLITGDTARLEKVVTPGWLFLDKAAVSGKVLNKPQGEDLKQNFNPKLIVEFYSR